MEVMFRAMTDNIFNKQDKKKKGLIEYNINHVLKLH